MVGDLLMFGSGGCEEGCPEFDGGEPAACCRLFSSVLTASFVFVFTALLQEIKKTKKQNKIKMFFFIVTLPCYKNCCPMFVYFVFAILIIRRQDLQFSYKDIRTTKKAPND